MKATMTLTVSLLSLLWMTACTDIPLSYNTVLSDKRLLGYWQLNDSSAMLFRMDETGTTKVSLYDYSVTEREYRQKGQKDVPVYFTTITINNRIHNFMSVKDENRFVNLEFSIPANGSLVFNALNAALFSDADGKKMMVFLRRLKILTGM